MRLQGSPVDSTAVSFVGTTAGTIVGSSTPKVGLVSARAGVSPAAISVSTVPGSGEIVGSATRHVGKVLSTEGPPGQPGPQGPVGRDGVPGASGTSTTRTYSLLVDGYSGADPTGVTFSDAAVAAAIAALGTARGVIEFGPGTYKLNNPAVLARSGQFFKGQGVGVTTIDWRGPGACFRVWDSTTAVDGNGAPGAGGGLLGGLTIWAGDNTNAGITGFKIGDLVGAQIDDLKVHGFRTAGSVGCTFSNRYGWLEYGRFRVFSTYNVNAFVLEAHPDHPRPYGGATSYSYNHFDFGMSLEADDNGVIIRGGVVAVGVAWNMNFNANPGPTNTGICFIVGDDWDTPLSPSEDPRGRDRYYNHIEASMNFFGEATNPGAVGHTDMVFGYNSSWRGIGTLCFEGYTANFQPGNVGPWDYKMNFAGRVNSASFGDYSKYETQLVTIGDYPRFAATGDDGRPLGIQEGSAPWVYPTITPRLAVSERTWDPVNEVNVYDDVSCGIALQSILSSTEEKKSLITLDGVNVVESLGELGVQVKGTKNASVAATEYIQLATLPPDAAENVASLRITGRFGGMEVETSAEWLIQLMNRSTTGLFDGAEFSSKVFGMGNIGLAAGIWSKADLVAYRQPDLSVQVWMKVGVFSLWNFNVQASQSAVVDWTVSSPRQTTVPSGTLVWSLHNSEKFSTEDLLAVKAVVDGYATGADGIRLQPGVPANSLEIAAGANTLGQDTYLNNHKLRDVGDPVDYRDAAHKGYVDAAVASGGGSGITRSVISVSTSTTLPSTALTDCVALLSTGAAPILPAAASNTNRYLLLNRSAGSVTVSCSASDTIEGASSVSLLTNASLELVSDGVSDWKMI